MLFTRYVFAFEVTSALLITAALGAMVLAHRERLTPEGDARPSLAAQRMRDYAESGKHPGPLPSPGVFARHNAVDTPALLPDGTASEASVSRVLAARGTVRSAPALADQIEEIAAPAGAERRGPREESIDDPSPTSSCPRSCSPSAPSGCSPAATRSWCSCASS